MSNIPSKLQERLASDFTFSTVILERKQGVEGATQKFLWRLMDGQFVESVLIPASISLHGETSDRFTLCVSTQVGCAYGCNFCASGLDGFKRNLEPAEIIDQVLSVERMQQGDGDRVITNLVIMGMGEPLANYRNLMHALNLLNSKWGANIGARKITISTSGLAPQIRKLAKEPQQYRLAVSLHGTTDGVREQIMPINKRYPIGELLDACETFINSHRKMITLEYILIDGVNDSIEQAVLLAAHARRLRAKVNLIPYNKVEGLDWKRPPENRIREFLRTVEKGRPPAITLRMEKGHDIDAACGQLRLREEKSEDMKANS